jgi:hypothetical protein
MKQGQASRTDRYGKVEPRSRAIGPANISQLGNVLGNHVTGKGEIFKGAPEPYDIGRGYSAPMNRTKTHKGGSQGSY